MLHWPLPGGHDLRDRLLSAWSTGRGYHDVQHLAEVLARLDELGAGDNVEVVLAAWFHDAVHDTAGDTAGDNEERSARMAADELSALSAQHGADVDVDIDEVVRLVRLTEHHRPEPGDSNGELLSDADLAILAAGPVRYAEYVAGVRAEYAGIRDADFARGRLAILRDLAAKPALFHTAHAREHWESAARANLAAEIKSLSNDPAVGTPGDPADDPSGGAGPQP